MSYLTSKVFWTRTAERVVGSFAAALAGVLGSGAVGLLAVAWPVALSTAAGAAVFTLLKCVVAASKLSPGDPGNPGFTK